MIQRGKGGSIVSILANYVWTGSAGTIHSAAAKAGVMSSPRRWPSNGRSTGFASTPSPPPCGITRRSKTALGLS